MALNTARGARSRRATPPAAKAAHRSSSRGRSPSAPLRHRHHVARARHTARRKLTRDLRHHVEATGFRRQQEGSFERTLVQHLVQLLVQTGRFRGGLGQDLATLE